MTLEDEFTREGLAIKVDRSIKAKDIICILANLFSEQGAPMYLRSDNGPEFIEKALKEWLVRNGDGHHVEKAFAGVGNSGQTDSGVSSRMFG